MGRKSSGNGWDSVSLAVIGAAAGLWLLMTLKAILVPLFLAFIVTIVSGTLLDTLTQRIEWEEMRTDSELDSAGSDANPQHLCLRDFCRCAFRGLFARRCPVAGRMNAQRDRASSSSAAMLDANLASDAAIDQSSLVAEGAHWREREILAEMGEHGPQYPIIQCCKHKVAYLEGLDPIARQIKHDIQPGACVEKTWCCWEKAVQGRHPARPGVCFCHSPNRMRAFQVRWLDLRNGVFGCFFYCRMPIVGAVLFVILMTVILFSVIAFFVWLQLRELMKEIPAYTAQFEVVVDDTAAQVRRGGAHSRRRVASVASTLPFVRLTTPPSCRSLTPGRYAHAHAHNASTPHKLRAWGLNYSAVDLHEKIEEYDLQSAILGFVSENFATLAGPLGTSVLFLIFLLPARADNTLPDILHATFGDSESKGYVHARASLRNIKHSVETYFKNKVFVAAINGIPAAIILTLWGAPIPLVFGLITFCMDFIPSIGSAIATFLPIPTLLLSPKGNGVFRAVGGFLSLTVMQNVIGNFIEPIIYASALNVRNVACLMSLLFWGFVWGIPGMILAMPTLIFIKIIVEELAARDRRSSEVKRSKAGGAQRAEDEEETWSLINCISFIIAPPEFSYGVKLESLAMANAAARGATAEELRSIIDDPTLFSHNRIVLTYSAGMSGEERRATLTVTPFSSDEKRKFYKRTGEAIGLANYFALKKNGKAPLAIAHKGRLPSSLDLAELAGASDLFFCLLIILLFTHYSLLTPFARSRRARSRGVGELGGEGRGGAAGVAHHRGRPRRANDAVVSPRRVRAPYSARRGALHRDGATDFLRRIGQVRLAQARAHDSP
jgi:predicted PurR-regulated permease PerM